MKKLLPILGIYAAIRMCYLGLPPLWDGASYYTKCLRPSALGSFNLFALDCSGHSSLVFAFLLSLPLRFFGPSIVGLNLMTTAIGIATLVLFHRLVIALSEEENDAWLATLVLATNPVFLATSTNVNLDMGVVLFFVGFLLFLVTDRRNAALLCGFALLFTKESGWLLYGSTVALHCFFSGRPRRYLVYALPVASLAAYLLAKRLSHKLLISDAVHESPRTLLHIFLTFDPGNRTFLSYLADVYFIQFSWLLSLVILVFLFRRLRAGKLVFALLATETFLLTRYSTWNDPRYMAPLLPLFFIAGHIAARALFRPRARHALFLALAGLYLVSTFRTVDPAAKWLFGTFRFGDHELLNLVSLTHEAAGYGRDQSVYNLEYANLSYLLDDAMADLEKLSGPILVAEPFAALNESGNPDRFALGGRLTTPPDFLKAAARPDRVFFVESPYYRNETALRSLRSFYPREEIKVYRRRGYELRVRVLTRSGRR